MNAIDGLNFVKSGTTFFTDIPNWLDFGLRKERKGWIVTDYRQLGELRAALFNGVSHWELKTKKDAIEKIKELISTLENYLEYRKNHITEEDLKLLDALGVDYK